MAVRCMCLSVSIRLNRPCGPKMTSYSWCLFRNEHQNCTPLQGDLSPMTSWAVNATGHKDTHRWPHSFLQHGFCSLSKLFTSQQFSLHNPTRISTYCVSKFIRALEKTDMSDKDTSTLQSYVDKVSCFSNQTRWHSRGSVTDLTV